MRRAAAVDANQAAIVGALRAYGASVQPLHSVGQGCPDLLVAHRGVNYLIEVKDGDKVPSARQLTEPQKVWHSCWRGQVAIANNRTEALEIIGAKTGTYRTVGGLK